MVIFNPQVSNQEVRDPNWTNVSRPISDIPPDKGSAIAIEAAGNILGSAVKAVDYDIKESAKQDVQTGVDNLRDAYTDSLKAMRNVQISSADGSLLPAADAPDAPPSLQNGIDRVKSIGTAIAQNGGSKINDTLYTGALNSLAKTLRSQYPGYRDYIDEQIQSVSGVNPANAFMKNLLEDINRNQENNKTEMNATLSVLRDNANAGFHDKSGVSAAQVYDGVRKGLIDPSKATMWLNSAKKVDYDRKTANDARADRQANDADSAVSAAKDLSSNVAKNLAHDWQTMTIGKGTDTMEGIANFIRDNAGTGKITDERAMAMGQQLTQLRNASYAARMAEANEGGKNSIVSHLGGDPTKAKAIIDGQYAVVDLAIQAIYQKDWGAAYSHMNFNKAIAADTTNIMYNAPDTDVRRYNRMVGAINDISPQFGKDFFQQTLLGGVPQREKEFIKNQKMELLTQPDAEQGKLTSIQSTIDTAKARGVVSPKSYAELIKTVDEISNPKIGIKQRLSLANGFFEPVANGQILADKNFDKDRYDPVLKREIPGKYSVFRKLTSDNVASGVGELGRTDPTVISNYRASMSRNFGEQLFSRELKDLGEANAQSTPTTANFKIKFTNDKGSTPHFEATRPDGSSMTMGEAIAYGAPVQSMNRLNEGMAGLYNVYEKTGSKDPVNDVMKDIYRYNYQDPNLKAPRGYESIGDMPKMIWNAIISANTARLKEVGDMVSGRK